jgi:hypothetical protein
VTSVPQLAIQIRQKLLLVSITNLTLLSCFEFRSNQHRLKLFETV